ncbi:hypothetical protein FHQ08_06145 [Lactobacillus sp. CC-MHH1034]|uniref:hypothetical protein n=1 Tax=Agrilactobacillus fermenti TaxID=2586909 RepID=UPI001E57EA77|nr:hypothetical protein [Agrilactobacillus fermenti]MCD2256298.1 hypothetical protein [Agrilactobacillus fermenti]
MKKWFNNASVSDTRMFMIIMALTSLLTLFFSLFLFPDPKVHEALGKVGSNGGAMIAVIGSISGAIGIVIGLFVTVYLQFLLYYIVMSIKKRTMTKEINQLAKRSFYISTAISLIVSQLINIIAMLIEQHQIVDTTFTIVVTVIQILVTIGLLYGFFKYLVKDLQVGYWIITVVFVVQLVIALMPIFSKYSL